MKSCYVEIKIIIKNILSANQGNFKIKINDRLFRELFHRKPEMNQNSQSKTGTVIYSYKEWLYVCTYVCAILYGNTLSN